MNQKYHIHLFPNKRITSKLYPKEPFKALSDMKNIFFCYEKLTRRIPSRKQKRYLCNKNIEQYNTQKNGAGEKNDKNKKKKFIVTYRQTSSQQF